ncbi:hypothetical protein ACOME3_002220 [Neoechinorhynchus agilis]
MDVKVKKLNFLFLLFQMGCTGSKTKDEDTHPYSDKVPLTTTNISNAVDTDQNFHDDKRFENVPYIDAAGTPATTVKPSPYGCGEKVKIERLSDAECVVTTSYQNQRVFNNEQTLSRLKEEAYDVVKKKMSEKDDEWEVLRHIQASSASNGTHEANCVQSANQECSCFDRSLMLRLIEVIRNGEGEVGSGIKNLDDLCKFVGKSNGDIDGKFDIRLEKCIAFLLEYAQSQSDRGSFLRAIGSRLSAGENDNLTGLDGLLNRTSGNDGITVHCREDENVEVMVKKTVIRKDTDNGYIKEYLASRGLEYSEDIVNAQEILIETEPPAEIDNELKKRAEMLMRLADSVNSADDGKVEDGNAGSSPDHSASGQLRDSSDKRSATSAETVLSEVVNELTEAIIKDF